MLSKEKILNINDYESLSIYEFCLLRKITKLPFIGKDDWASDVLSLVYTNVCGSMNMTVRGEYYYFIIFIDDPLRYGYIYIMKYKSKSFEIFKWFHSEVEK